MLKTLERTYLSVFRRYPSLIPLVMLAACGELVYAVVNYYGLPLYLTEPTRNGGLGIADKSFPFALIFTFLLAEMACKYPYGHLSDHYGRKPFILIGALVCAVTPVALVLLPARARYAFYSLRAVDGAGAAAIWPPLFGAVSDITDPKWRATALSILNTVYISGLAIGPAVGGLLADAFNDLRIPFFMSAGLLLTTAAIAWFWLPETVKRSDGAKVPAPHSPYATVLMGLLIGGGISFALSLLTVQDWIRFSPAWAATGSAGLAALATAAYVWIQTRVCGSGPEDGHAAPACMSLKAAVSCIAIGPAAGGLLGWLTADLNLRVPALICAAIAGVLLLWHSRLRLAADRRSRQVQSIETAALPLGQRPGEDIAPAAAEPLPEYARMPMVVMAGVSGGLMFASMLISPVLALYARNVLHLGYGAAGAMFMGPGICAAVLGAPLGRLADRTSRVLAIRLALVVAAAALALVPSVRGMPALIGIVTAVMLSFLFGFSSWLALVSEHAPEGGGGRTMGMVLAAQSVGAVIGPKATEWLMHLGAGTRNHGLEYPFYGAAIVLGLLAVVAMIWIHDPRTGRPRRQPRAPAEQVAN